ncbi:MAG: ATP-binding cassette domain-containing protein [Bifidobacteriaceae bacterium]|jgi:ABC-2 type transport system ATP-binding protein|nr:ATP-binding cassette domain-containing protein [Bifidobacteriaceae bacterium]
MIEVRDVHKRYRGKAALDGVSLTVPDGAVTGLVGPNGAGKTTLIKAIAGLIRTDSGTLRVDGAEFRRAARPIQTLGCLVAADALPPKARGVAILEYACRANGVATRRAAQLMDQVGLGAVARNRIGSYSLGMRQRLALALALVGRPGNLVLDEPFNGLDPHWVQALRQVLATAAGQGAAVLVSSHILSELDLIADRFALVSDGRVSRQFDSQSRHPDAGVAVEVVTAEPDAAQAALGAARLKVSRDRRSLVIEGAADAPQVARALLDAGVSFTSLGPKRTALEDAVLLATGNGGTSA